MAYIYTVYWLCIVCRYRSLLLGSDTMPYTLGSRYNIDSDCSRPNPHIKNRMYYNISP